MVPKVSEVNLTPTSMLLPSPESTPPGVALVPHTEHGQVTPMVIPAEGCSRLPLSSTARVLIVLVGAPWAIQLYVQLVVPVAGCQVEPPSVDTSTPATVPPESLAVPLIVTDVPSGTVPPGAGEVIVEVGAVVSVEAVAAWMPEIGVDGWAPMSANRFTVACCC